MCLLTKAETVVTPVAVSDSNDLKCILREKIIVERERIKLFRKSKGKCNTSDITINQMYNGMCGINALVCETSTLDPKNGILFRGLSIPEVLKCLPKAKGGKQPLPEGVFWLFMTGDIPTDDQVQAVSEEWAHRSAIPDHVITLLDNMCPDVHPMSQLSCAVTALNGCSQFVFALHDGMKKPDYWEYYYEDCMDLIAKLPTIAAKIYSNTYCNGAELGVADPCNDWAANLTTTLGFNDPEFVELMRLYLTIYRTDQATHISKMDPDFAQVWTKIASLLTRVKSLPTGCESPHERSAQKRSSGESHPVGNDFTLVSKDAIFVQTCAKSGSIFDICVACDYEGGNVTAHATHMVSSALADPFISFASGLNGLAGPLHGPASQNALMWVLEMQQELGDKATEKDVQEYVTKALCCGQMVPGYGRLSKTDPRYECQRKFALEHLPDDCLFRLVSTLYKVVPPLLKEACEITDPWPNGHAHSGVLLHYYGLTALDYYTVLFGVSRSLGVIASSIWDRAMGYPIERPRSFSTESLMKEFEN